MSDVSNVSNVKSVAKIQLQKEFISKYTIGLLTYNQQTKLLKLQTKTPAERLQPQTLFEIVIVI